MVPLAVTQRLVRGLVAGLSLVELALEGHEQAGRGVDRVGEGPGPRDPPPLAPPPHPPPAVLRPAAALHHRHHHATSPSARRPASVSPQRVSARRVSPSTSCAARSS